MDGRSAQIEVYETIEVTKTKEACIAQNQR